MKHVKWYVRGSHDAFQKNYNKLVNGSTPSCWTYYIPCKTKSFYDLIFWFEKNISGVQGEILGGGRNEKKEFDFIFELVKWGGVAEESVVGSIFQGDVYLITITDRFLRKVLIA